jgi:nitroreductase
VDALDAIFGRKVVREFLNEPVELKQLVKIADAGRHAMSARNLQPWHFIIVRDPKTLRELGAERNRSAEGQKQRALGR